MSRKRRPHASRPRRRRSHDPTADCVIARAPTADAAWFGVCENLGLWRIKAPPFDAHGVIEPDGELDGFYAALEDAVAAIRDARPDLAGWLQGLLDRRADPE